VLQCVTVCCSVLQCVAVRLQRGRGKGIESEECNNSATHNATHNNTQCNTQCNTLQHTGNHLFEVRFRVRFGFHTHKCVLQHAAKHAATHCFFFIPHELSGQVLITHTRMCFSVPPCVAVCGSVRCRVLQCVLQPVAVCYKYTATHLFAFFRL